MTEIDFQINVIDEAGDSSPLLDADQIDTLLDSTRTEFRQHILNRVGGLMCEIHEMPPKVMVIGTYSLDTEQIEISYNIEACCNLMTMRTAALLGS